MAGPEAGDELGRRKLLNFRFQISNFRCYESERHQSQNGAARPERARPERVPEANQGGAGGEGTTAGAEVRILQHDARSTHGLSAYETMNENADTPTPMKAQ